MEGISLGKSATVTVSVNMKSAELTIVIGRAEGLPGLVQLRGILYSGVQFIGGAKIELWVNGSLKKTTTTDGYMGAYVFDYRVGEGSYDFYTRFPGDATHFSDDSPLVVGEYAKAPTNLSIDVNPLYGDAPLAVTILGLLTRNDTSEPLPGKTVTLYRNGVALKSMTTKTTSPGQGMYEFHDTISTPEGVDYYVYFKGDDLFEGCDVAGAAAADGGEEPPVPPEPEEPSEAGLGLLILAALVLSQE